VQFLVTDIDNLHSGMHIYSSVAFNYETRHRMCSYAGI